MTKSVGTIYGLTDPRVDSVLRFRYIGITGVSLQLRLRRHIYETKTSKGRHHRARWIRSLLLIGLEPKIEAVAVDVPIERLFAEEINLIANYRAMGCLLTNSTAGGEGCLSPSPETRAKIGLKSRGNQYRRGKKMPLDVVEKMAARKRGSTFNWSHPMSDEQRKLISLMSTGRKHTEETKAQIGEASRLRIRQPHTKETKEKIAASLLGNKQPMGENSRYAKLRWNIVREIRHRYDSESISQAELGREFNISQQMVSLLIQGKKWVEPVVP